MTIDRLSMRKRPAGRPVMHQTWSKLLFMHWPIPPAQLRGHVPGGLEIDTFDDTAWIGVTPFTMPRLRLPHLPAPPFFGHSHEINVRTYVHLHGQPGVWFFSLDANNTPAVIGARLAFALPYFRARMSLEERGDRIRFRSLRTHPGARDAAFSASWRRGEKLPQAQPDTLEFFLTERYCLYAARRRRLCRARIHHEPWTLCRAELDSYSSTLVEANGLPAPEGDPILHGQQADLEVDVWPPSRAR